MKRVMEKYNALPKEERDKWDKVIIPVILVYYHIVIYSLWIVGTVVFGIAGAVLNPDYPVSGFFLGALCGLSLGGYIIYQGEWL